MAIAFRRTALVAAGCSFLLCSISAQERSPEDVIKGRQSNLHDLGSAYKSLTDELKKGNPVFFIVQQYIDQINQLAKQSAYWFPGGTGPEAGIDTKARSLIWQTPDDFASRMQSFRTQVDKLFALRSSVDSAAISAQIRSLGEACKACHDKYREPED
jgi:cytochrome c556